MRSASIKPKIKVIKDNSNKKQVQVVDQSEKDNQNQEELKFHYSTLAYDSYVKEGFKPPDEYDRPDAREKDFLSKVNIDYGKIKVKVTRMIRVKAPDYTSDKQEMKEYLVFESEWTAYDNYGGEIRLGPVHEEGKYIMQTRQLHNELNKNTGKMISMYLKGNPKVAYSIPFSKTEVDKYLKGEHPFGPDSINITNPDRVIYYGKFEYRDTGTMPFRCGMFTYEQFTNPSWRTFAELASRPGGPVGQVWRHNNKDNDNQSHIT